MQYVMLFFFFASNVVKLAIYKGLAKTLAKSRSVDEG